MTYKFEISVLSKAPQNIDKSLKIGDIEIKKSNQKIDLKDVIKAVKKQFKIISVPILISSNKEEAEFRETVHLTIRSFREFDSKISIEGIPKSMFHIKVKEVYVK